MEEPVQDTTPPVSPLGAPKMRTGIWSRSAVIIFILGLMMLVTGLWLHAWALYIAGSFLLIILLLTRIVFAPWPVRGSKTNLVVSRKMHEGTIQEDDQVDVLATVKGARGQNIVEAYDKNPTYSSLDKGTNLGIWSATSVPKGGVRYTVYFPMRGHYEIGPIETLLSDPLLLFSRHEVHKSTAQDVTVHPTISDLKDVPMQSRSFRQYAGPTISNQPGKSTEFFSIREYTLEDPFNSINWKAYAKTKKLMVNIYERENICDAIVFLDARAYMGAGTIENNPMKYASKAANSICKTLLKERNRVSAVIYGDGVRVIPPGYGTTHHQYIEEALIKTVPQGDTNLYSAVYIASRYVYPKTTVYIISSMEFDPSIQIVIKELMKREVDVRAILIPSIPFECQPLGCLTPKARLAQLQTMNIERSLKRAGVLTQLWSPKDQIDTSLTKMKLIEKELRRGTR